jgi:hypothetical protein
MRKFCGLVIVTCLISAPANPANVNHAIAKKTVHHRHPGQARPPMAYQGNPYGWGTGYRYDWQAGDCDITNKTSLNTCTNGGM